jgi:hypothetical protein
MHQYKIPTKRDIERLHARLDQLEKLIKATAPHSARGPAKSHEDLPKSATDIVLDLIKQKKTGIRIPDIREQTGYDDKKLRNVIYRLNKMEKIQRVSRGCYIAVE